VAECVETGRQSIVSYLKALRKNNEFAVCRYTFVI